MAFSINMPQVGQDIEYARIIEWHIKEGDKIRKGDIIATVESDKASFEVESTGEGDILRLLYSEGDEARVFKPIAFIGKEGEEIEHLIQEKQVFTQSPESVFLQRNESIQVANSDRNFSSPSARRVAREMDIQITNLIGTGPDGRIVKRDVLKEAEKRRFNGRITPLARSIATMEGVNLSQLNGSGSNSRIQKKDVYGFLSRPVSKKLEPSPDDTIIFFDRTSKIISDRLTFSKQTVPHFYLFTDINMDSVVQFRASIKEESTISLTDIIIKVAGDTLLEFPRLNSHVDFEKVLVKSSVNIGVAVASDKGLMVPVITDVPKLDMFEIHDILIKKSYDARRGIVNNSDYASFTISNLGMYGIPLFLPIINPPEAAILSVGSLEKKPGIVNGELAIINSMTIGLACDHRAVDGAYASGFLAKLKSNLESINYPV